MKTTLNKNTEHTSVNVRSILPDGIFLSALGRDYYVSFERLPWFKTAKVSDIINVSLIGDYAIRWDDLEIEILMHPEKYPLIMKRTIDEVL